MSPWIHEGLIVLEPADDGAGAGAGTELLVVVEHVHVILLLVTGHFNLAHA